MHGNAIQLRLRWRIGRTGTDHRDAMTLAPQIAVESVDKAPRWIAGTARIGRGDHSDVHGSITRLSRRRRAHSRHGRARSTTNSTG